MAEHDMQPHQQTWQMVTRLIVYGALSIVLLLGLLAVWLVGAA